MRQDSGSSTIEPTVVTYPGGLYWSAIGLAFVSVIIHVYFGLFVYTGTSVIPMLGIATVYLVGIGLVASNFRRGLWLKIGILWTVVLVALWAAAAFLANAPHTLDPLAYAVNAVEAFLAVVLLATFRYSKIHTSAVRQPSSSVS